MSDWHEARMEAMDDVASEHRNEGKTEMQNLVLDLIDETIKELFESGTRLGDEKFHLLEKLKTQVQNLD